MRHPSKMAAMFSYDKQAFVNELEKQHGRSLRRYLASRLRNPAIEVEDLAQEVFLRLLRVAHHETIRNPEAYVITIASHVLHQHALRQSAIAEAPYPANIEALESSESDPAAQMEVQQRVALLERTLMQLSRKARATLILHRRDGLSLNEIGLRLGISRSMAKKYLAQALSHCRQRSSELK
ncbi:MAG: RNA polymerase sigma factor [Steroidobacteraceae bacterium]